MNNPEKNQSEEPLINIVQNTDGTPDFLASAPKNNAGDFMPDRLNVGESILESSASDTAKFDSTAKISPSEVAPEIAEDNTELMERKKIFFDEAGKFIKIKKPSTEEIKHIGETYKDATGEKLETKVLEAVVEKAIAEKEKVVKSEDLLDDEKNEKTRLKYECEAREERRIESIKKAWNNLSKEERQKLFSDKGVKKVKDFINYLIDERSRINGELENEDMISEDAFYEMIRKNKIEDIEKMDPFNHGKMDREAKERIWAAGRIKMYSLIKKGREHLRDEKNSCRIEIVKTTAEDLKKELPVDIKVVGMTQEAEKEQVGGFKVGDEVFAIVEEILSDEQFDIYQCTIKSFDKSDPAGIIVNFEDKNAIPDSGLSWIRKTRQEAQDYIDAQNKLKESKRKPEHVAEEAEEVGGFKVGDEVFVIYEDIFLDGSGSGLSFSKHKITSFDKSNPADIVVKFKEGNNSFESSLSLIRKTRQEAQAYTDAQNKSREIKKMQEVKKQAEEIKIAERFATKKINEIRQENGLPTINLEDLLGEEYLQWQKIYLDKLAQLDTGEFLKADLTEEEKDNIKEKILDEISEDSITNGWHWLSLREREEYRDIGGYKKALDAKQKKIEKRGFSIPKDIFYFLTKFDAIDLMKISVSFFRSKITFPSMIGSKKMLSKTQFKEYLEEIGYRLRDEMDEIFNKRYGE